jgi:hypothetical protein
MFERYTPSITRVEVTVGRVADREASAARNTGINIKINLRDFIKFFARIIGQIQREVEKGNGHYNEISDVLRTLHVKNGLYSHIVHILVYI